MDDIESTWWFRFIRHFSLIIALKTAIVTGLCYYAGFYLSAYYHFAFPEVGGLWCVISGIIVLQVFIGESFSAAWLRILGSFVGALTSAIFAALFGYSIFILIVCVFFTVVLTAIFKIKQTFRLASLTAAIVIIVGIASKGQLTPFINAASRFAESAIGAGIAIAITSLVYPLRKKLHLLQK